MYRTARWQHERIYNRKIDDFQHLQGSNVYLSCGYNVMILCGDINNV